MIKKRKVMVILFLGLFTSVVPKKDFISQDFAQTRQLKSCFLSLNYFFSFIFEVLKYEGSADEHYLKVECSECKDKRGSIEFLSSLIGTILKECCDTEKFKTLKPYAEEAITLIKERNVSEINKLAVKVGNLLPIKCHDCKKSLWQIIDLV